MTRSTAKYLALLVVTVILFYWRTVLTGQYTLIVGSEGVNQAYAWLHLWVRSVWQGHIPLWDPYAFAGSPFVGETLTAAFYPFRALFALVPLNRNGLISPNFYHDYLALAHIVCAWFMFAMLREMGRSRFASFIGACAFSLGGLLVRMIWPEYIESCIWLPAVFLFLLRALRAERRDRALLEAAASGFSLGLAILTGGMAFFIMQALVVVTAVGYFAVSTRPVSASAPQTNGQSHWIRMGLILGVALVVAGGIGAVQLVPAMEYSKLSLRWIDGGIFPADKKIPYNRLVPGMWPQSIVAAIFPAGFDGKVGGEETFPFYIGVLPFFLALAGIWKCRENLWVRYLAVLAVLSFAYSLGEFSPLHGMLYAVAPLFWMARSANRFLYLISFALAVLAAFGLDALLDSAGRENYWVPARRILKWIAIGAGAALFVSGLFVSLNLSIWNAMSLLLILGSCGLFYYLTEKSASPATRLALAAFIIFDLAAFNWPEANKATMSKADDGYTQVASLRNAVTFVKSQPGPHRVRVGVAVEPNIGDIYGVESVWGGAATVLSSYSDIGLRDDLLNVRYTIKPASAADPNPVFQDANWKVYQNSNAFPRGWIVHDVDLQPSHEAAFRRFHQPDIDFHRTAILEARLPQSPDRAAGGDESVRFRSYEPERMAMDVNSVGTGLLVLSEMYYPGWFATIDGKPAKINRVDGAFRGIVVPNGSSRVELVYSPSSVHVGAIITLVTLLCLGLGWIYVRRGESADQVS